MQTEASKTLAEALQNSRSELLEEKERRTARTKGKAKVTVQDEEEEAKFRRRIEEYDIALADTRDTGLDIMPDEEPIWNPLTSSYAYRETGFEPGPSGLNGKSRQHQQSMKLEHEVSSDARLDIGGYFAGSSPVWMQYPEQPQQTNPRHIPEEFIEVHAGIETLRTGPPASTARREVAIDDFDSGDDQSSQTPRGRFAYMANTVQSWMAPGLRRWLFGAKSTVNATNQISPDRTRSCSRLSSSSSSKSAINSFGAGSSSASTTSTDTPQSSLSSGSSKRRSVGRLQQNLRHRRSPSHSNNTGKLAELRAKFVLPRPTPVVSHENEPSSSSETLRQNPNENLFPRSQRAQQQRQQTLDQERDTLGQYERGTRQIWSEDESWLLALSLDEEDRAKKEEYEHSQRVAMRLQLQEDKEVAEQQEALEKEWLQERTSSAGSSVGNGASTTRASSTRSCLASR